MADKRYTINACTINVLPAESRKGEALSALAGTQGRQTPLLELLMREDVRATFFVEHTIAHTHPALLQEIAAQGHEIALLISSVPPSDPSYFHNVVSEGKEALESLLQRRIFGCRILPFSQSGGRSTEEYKILADAGFLYSSSTYSPRDFRFGIQNSKRRAWTVELHDAMLWELPLTAWRLFGLGILSVPSTHSHQHRTWAIARSIDGMNRHGEPALLSQHCEVPATASILTIAETVAGRLEHIFRAYRFSTTFDAFASRLIRGFNDEERAMGRRTSIIRCDSRTAATIL